MLGFPFLFKAFNRYFFTNKKFVVNIDNTWSRLDKWKKSSSAPETHKDLFLYRLGSMDKSVLMQIRVDISKKDISKEEIKLALKESAALADVELLGLYLSKLYENEPSDWITEEIRGWVKQASANINLNKLIKLEALANKFNLDEKNLFYEIDKEKVDPETHAKLIRILNSPNTDHQTLIKLGLKLGYSLPDKGVCNGYTMRWIEASLLDQNNTFLNRKNKISELYSRLSEPGVTLEDLKKQPEWRTALWDIKAFYESLLLYQNPEVTSEILGKFVTQEDIEAISDVASSDMIKARGGIKNTANLRYAQFTKDKLFQVLTEVENKIQASDYQQPVCLRLSCYSEKLGFHVINVTHYPRSPHWQWMNINGVLQDSDDLQSLLSGIKERRSGIEKRYQFFSVSAILPIKGTSELETKLLELRKSEQEEKEFALFKGSYAGDLEVVRLIVDEDNLNINQARYHGFTALFLAAKNGHFDIVKLLLQSPTIRTDIPFISSAQSLNEFAESRGDEIIQRMKEFIQKKIDLGADEKKLKMSPAEVAYIMGHDKIFAAIESRSIQLTQSSKATLSAKREQEQSIMRPKT